MKINIDDESTNGDIIKTMFPQLKIRILPDIVIVFGEDNIFQHHYPIEWWNAKYKLESEEGMEELDFIQPKKTVGKLISINEYKDKLDKIRKEISAIDINGQVDANTLFVRTGEQVKRMVLEIIDKYKSESDE